MAGWRWGGGGGVRGRREGREGVHDLHISLKLPWELAPTDNYGCGQVKVELIYGQN